MKRIRFSKVSMSSIVRLLRLSLALASALLCACQVAPYEVINVDIREYPSVQSNLELAQAISRYARVYLAAHVPSYDDAYEKYINYGASSDTSDGGRAFVWVRFDYKVDGMLERKSALRSEIRSHFENLAKEHAANASVFEALEPSGESIVNALVSGRGDALYANFASVLASRLLPEEWGTLCGELARELSGPTQVRYAGAQHYGAFRDQPTHVSQFFVLEYQNKPSVEFRVTQVEESGQWKLCGYGVYPQGEE